MTLWRKGRGGGIADGHREGASRRSVRRILLIEADPRWRLQGDLRMCRSMAINATANSS